MSNNKSLSARASLCGIKTSPRKLSLVANMIAKMSVAEAVRQLTFCRKGVALDVKKCLLSAIANAEYVSGFDVDRLFIETITVGKSFVLKRFMPRARGKGSRIQKCFSSVYITLSSK